MKKILLVACFLSAVVSCKKSGFLDNKSTTVLDEALTFSDSARTMMFLTRIYADVGYSFSKGRWSSHGNSEQATDDAEYSFSGTGQGAVILYNGTVSPTNFLNTPLSDFWNLPYVNIRRVNLLLSKLPVTPLPASIKERVKGEARFLRAWYYSQLLISFGGIPLVDDNVYGIDDIIDLPRASFADCVTYLTKELNEAAVLLPQVYPADIDYGRITKGACMALKSRILLYAASPLFNGGSVATEASLANIVGYPVYDVKYWQASAAAALELINSSYYSLNVDNTTLAGFGFYNVFLQRYPNAEYIFGLYRPANRDFEGFYNPGSRGGAKYSMPTQNLVEAFPMKNGRAITDPTSGYNPVNPYVNRDPRFRYSIIFHNSRYQNGNTGQAAVLTNDSSGTADAFGDNTTGYFSRKMCDSTIAANSSANTNRAWPLIRYAEIVLNYAEAINETGQTQLAYPKLTELRSRAGIDAGTDNLYGLKPNMSIGEMRSVIQNERRIELAFEDHRWHDIRRWKIAMVTNNAFNNRIKISKSGLVYTVVPSIRRHNFRPEMYLLPIPDPELRKMPSMVQNPGW
ncbi:MAG: RagB/SusD family nutrient uptake outer membrane protein [Ferruginibacter sp.]|nr:RagB/SusD family nutrient uptake outer membrane protein [Ferruginibacter sp.]